MAGIPKRIGHDVPGMIVADARSIAREDRHAIQNYDPERSRRADPGRGSIGARREHDSSRSRRGRP